MQEGDEVLTQLLAVSAAAAVDLRMGAGQQQDRFQEGLMAVEHLGDSVDDLAHHVPRDIARGAHPVEDLPDLFSHLGQAVLVDGQEQRLLGVHPGIDRPWWHRGPLTHRRDGEGLIPAFAQQLDSGGQGAFPGLAAALLQRWADAVVDVLARFVGPRHQCLPFICRAASVARCPPERG